MRRRGRFFQRGVYVGPIAHLQGKAALLIEHHQASPVLRVARPRRLNRADVLYAQFDCFAATKRSYRGGQMRPKGLRRLLAFNWHPFHRTHWVLTPDQ